MVPIDRKVAGKTKPSQAERAKVEASFSAMPDGERFQLFNLGSAEDVESKWGNRIFEERDWSEAADEIAASIGTVIETIVDSTSYSLGEREGGKEDFDTVSVHAYSNERPHLLAVERGDNRSGKPISAPTPAALRGGLDLAAKHGKKLAEAPLIGLAPELVSADERRLLIAHGFSYALRLMDDPFFSHIRWRPEDDMDAREPLPASCIFGIRHADSDDSKTCAIAMRDLADTRPNSRGRFREHLVRVPRRDGPPLYFVARADLPDGTDERERERQAKVLALRATKWIADPPGREMRIHQFHHHDPTRYREVLQAVNFARISP